MNRPANGKSSASRKYSTAFSRGFRLDTLRTSAGFQVLKGLGEILANYGISDFETGITKEFPAEMKVDLYFIRGMGAIENRPAVTVRLIGTCEATDTVGDDEGTTPPHSHNILILLFIISDIFRRERDLSRISHLTSCPSSCRPWHNWEPSASAGNVMRMRTT